MAAHQYSSKPNKTSTLFRRSKHHINAKNIPYKNAANNTPWIIGTILYYNIIITDLRFH